MLIHVIKFDQGRRVRKFVVWDPDRGVRIILRCFPQSETSYYHWPRNPHYFLSVLSRSFQNMKAQHGRVLLSGLHRPRVTCWKITSVIYKVLSASNYGLCCVNSLILRMKRFFVSWVVLQNKKEGYLVILVLHWSFVLSSWEIFRMGSQNVQKIELDNMQGAWARHNLQSLPSIFPLKIYPT